VVLGLGFSLGRRLIASRMPSASISTVLRLISLRWCVCVCVCVRVCVSVCVQSIEVKCLEVLEQLAAGVHHRHKGLGFRVLGLVP
jgi:hypothetical protein